MAKKLLLLAAVIGLIYYCLQETTPSSAAYVAQLYKSRAAKNQSFRQAPNSPLTAAQRAQFDSLKYYPGDEQYAVAGQVTRNPRPDTVRLQMSDGHATYGGGRYFDVVLPKLDAPEITLDFNTAYNPYCAYNNEYSCPVPPAENRLTVAVPAGEKSFHD